MYSIEILVNSNPDSNPTGFQDFISVSHNGKVIYSGMCSTSPNGFSPRARLNWRKCYGWISPQIAKTDIITNHRRFGGCILLNGGHKVDSRIPNKKHGGEMIMTEIFIHKSMGIINKKWRGSAGCITMPKKELKIMIKSILKVNKNNYGYVTIKDNSRFNI